MHSIALVKYLAGFSNRVYVLKICCVEICCRYYHTVIYEAGFHVTSHFLWNTRCRYDHQERLTAEEAMQHPYFNPIRGLIAQRDASVQPSASGAASSAGAGA
jgi:hypothetical protein